MLDNKFSMRTRITKSVPRGGDFSIHSGTNEALGGVLPFEDGEAAPGDLARWLRETAPERLARLYEAADTLRARRLGHHVHLRGLIEISSHCVRSCGYCGLRAGNLALSRYRMSATEILECAQTAASLAYGTVVLQAGEDPGISREWMADIIRRIKELAPLAVTLSLGERSLEDLAAWKEAGADRYLLRFETSDPELYRLIHPPLPGQVSDRIALLRELRRLGYEIGGGVMVGIPGQTFASLAGDILTFRALDLDMIGIGPYIPHPQTPLGRGEWTRAIAPEDQVPASEEMVYKTLALTRLACPEANIPSTTALATINRANGRELGLQRGANVLMPNLTPPAYRALYEIYPNKACALETAEQCVRCIDSRLMSIGRVPGEGPGGRSRASRAHPISGSAGETTRIGGFN